MASSPRTKVRQTLQGAEMIQLATDPNASRSNWRPSPADSKESTMTRRPRSAHAWPFISRHGERNADSQATKRSTSSEAGS